MEYRSYPNELSLARAFAFSLSRSLSLCLTRIYTRAHTNIHNVYILKYAHTQKKRTAVTSLVHRRQRWQTGTPLSLSKQRHPSLSRPLQMLHKINVVDAAAPRVMIGPMSVHPKGELVQVGGGATVPGLKWGLVVFGWTLRAALEATCLLGALPPTLLSWFWP